MYSLRSFIRILFGRKITAGQLIRKHVLGRGDTAIPHAFLYAFFGGRSNATASCSKCPRCDASQKGLFLESPQRQIETTVRPCKPYASPFRSTISKSPSIFTDPLLLIVSLVLAILFFLFCGQTYHISASIRKGTRSLERLCDSGTS